MKYNTRPDAVSEYLKKGFAADIEKFKMWKDKKTGFQNLDNELGGLYPGLYVVGGISSIGKTSFVLQMTDQIAQEGTDVLIFSLEMARKEIMAKSISRHTFQSVLATGGDIRNAKTAMGIIDGERYKNYSQAEKDLINRAVMKYGKYAQNIYIDEGIGDIGVNQIRETIKKHIRFTGKTPVVVIDHLQALALYTDEQNTDKVVIELKRISRDYKMPVICISSMEVFKESEVIEHISDVLIDLQFKGAEEENFDEIEAKRRNPREIELVILKNRNGRTEGKISFNYYPPFNYFVEA